MAGSDVKGWAGNADGSIGVSLRPTILLPSRPPPTPFPMRQAPTILALITSACMSACSSPSATVMPFLGSMGLDGELSIADTSNPVRTSSSFDELGLNDDEASLGGLVRLSLGGAELSIAGMSLDYEGSGTTNGEFTLDGQTIGADVAVDTGIELQMARALFTWDLIPIGGVDLGFGIGATIIDIKFDLRDQLGLASLSTDQVIPVPLIGARAAWTWGPVNLRADVGGIMVEYDGDEATVIDGEVSASVEFLDIGDLVVGYRTTRIDAIYEDDSSKIDADFRLEGYYFGLQFGF